MEGIEHLFYSLARFQKKKHTRVRIECLKKDLSRKTSKNVENKGFFAA